MKLIYMIFLLIALGLPACHRAGSPETLDISRTWLFAPDSAGMGLVEGWYDPAYDDSRWDTLDAGLRWEEQGYPVLDSLAWYRKRVTVPRAWKSKEVWIKFGGVNDAFDLFVNGKKVCSYGASAYSFAGKPVVVELTGKIRYGEANLIAVQVNDWGNSGGLWRLPVIITTDRKETDLFKPLLKNRFVPEQAGYRLVWQDDFNGDRPDSSKWSVRGVGPRAIGYVSPEAVKVEEGFLKLIAFVDHDTIKTGAVGTQGKYMMRYGYFECRARLQKNKGNWAAFWIQSPDISQGEDPGVFGTEIDIMEYFRKEGGDFVSHNIHWAYGPHIKHLGPFLSKVKGVGKGFHTFAAEWTPEKYAFFVDGYKYYEVKKAVSHIEEYIILSMELPHNRQDLDVTQLPDTFLVDYVKVYQKR